MYIYIFYVPTFTYDEGWMCSSKMMWLTVNVIANAGNWLPRIGERLPWIDIGPCGIVWFVKGETQEIYAHLVTGMGVGLSGGPASPLRHGYYLLVGFNVTGTIKHLSVLVYTKGCFVFFINVSPFQRVDKKLYFNAIIYLGICISWACLFWTVICTSWYSVDYM